MTRNWLLLVLLAAGLPAAAADMYTWTDATGVKHFSDSPPPDASKVQKYQFSRGVTHTTTENQPTADANANATTGPKMAAAAGYAPEDIKRNCETARKNLETLQAQPVPVDEDGKPTDPDAAKSHQGQVDRANQQIKLFCGN